MLHTLHREEEIPFAQRQISGDFKAGYSELRWDAKLYRPAINDLLCQSIPGWKERIKWPQGKTFAACLTHDVDSARLKGRWELIRTISSHLRQAKGPGEWLRHALSVSGLRHFQSNADIIGPWMDEEKKYGFHSTFYYFPTRVSQRDFRDCTYRWDDPVYYRGEKVAVREIVQDIHRQGWEVGLHSSVHSAQNGDLLSEQKEDVETALGHPVYTIRQHNLYFDITKTPRLQERAGFQCDSTMGFNRDVGFRSGIAYPHRIFDFEKKDYLSLFEIPLVLHDCALLRMDNLDMPEEIAFDVCRLLIDRVAQTRGVITLLWHPYSIVDKGWFSLYARLLGYIHEKNGWGASTKEIYDWWIGQGLDGVLEEGLKTVSGKL